MDFAFELEMHHAHAIIIRVVDCLSRGYSAKIVEIFSLVPTLYARLFCIHYTILSRNKRFALNEMLQRTGSIFSIIYI